MMITVGVATLKNREESFKRVIESIYPQVDKIVAVLNLYEAVPDWLGSLGKVRAIVGDNSLGDAGKFLEVNSTDGVYFAIDDDLLYPKGYADYMMEGIEKYNGIVSLHGKIYTKPVLGFKNFKYVYRCLGTVTGDVHVNMIGSGCCAFSTNRLKLSVDDFYLPNMADIFLSKVAMEQGVTMTVLKHNSGYLKYLAPPKGTTIWESTKNYEPHSALLKSFIK